MAEPWRLAGFSDRLDEWISLEAPPDWLRVLVGNWVLSRIEDPYGGLRRQPDFDNLWFGVVPGSVTEEGTAVACSLWIYERAHAVRCDRIATLSWPIE
jgi:hypothetical protein